MYSFQRYEYVAPWIQFKVVVGAHSLFHIILECVSNRVQT